MNMKKLEFGIVALINFKKELLDRYGMEVKVRNYSFVETPDPYFILEHKPSKEIKEFIWDYFDKMDGLVAFTSDGKRFFVYG